MRRRGGLQGRLFLAFGVAIVVTGATVGLVFHLTGGERRPRHVAFARWERFAAARFAEAWDDSDRRRELARSLAADGATRVRLLDEAGRTLEAHGGNGRCFHRRRIDVDGRGVVELCARSPRRAPSSWVLAIGLAISAVVLWALAGMGARRLARPLRELTRVARDIGEGRLERRARLRHGHRGEVGELTVAINEMAARIERQIRAERELLATVSHELRTPLTRIRLLLELGREDRSRDAFSEIEAELVEMDSLVGDLLAGARIDFAALTVRDVDARELAEKALERARIEDARLEVEGDSAPLAADAALLSRALVALVDNAKKHGGGPTTLRVVGEPEHVRFEVEDGGPGFQAGEAERIFEPFARGSGTDSQTKGVGLGLSLVRRIAEAHGGRAWAENRPGGGARVVMRVGRVPVSPSA